MLIEKYIEQKMSLKQIGAQYNLTAASILTRLRLFGIPSRSTSERTKIWWNDNPQARELARIRGRLIKQTYGKKTDIEKLFEHWAMKNDVKIKYQHRLDVDGHAYDYLLLGTKTLIEVDGDRWHSMPDQIVRDHNFDSLARGLNFTVRRFLRSQILKTKSKCFDVLLVCQHDAG